jgi:hypothetical protein
MEFSSFTDRRCHIRSRFHSHGARRFDFRRLSLQRLLRLVDNREFQLVASSPLDEV